MSAMMVTFPKQALQFQLPPNSPLDQNLPFFTRVSMEVSNYLVSWATKKTLLLSIILDG